MPYLIKQDGSKHCVFKKTADGSAGELVKCHMTEDDAKDHMAALYANVTKAVKFADDAHDVIEGLGMPWGGPFNGKDVTDEFFSVKTDFAFDWFDERPLLYHHGLDDVTQTAVVGRVKAHDVTDLGVWVKAQLDKKSKYFDAIKNLVKDGSLFFSSGSMRHLVKVNGKSGEIERWPWVELSLTPTPANPYAEVDFPSAEKNFETAGIKADLKVLQEGLDTAGGVLVKDENTIEPVEKQPAPNTKMAPAMMKQMMKDMAAEMGVEMSEEDMDEMMAKLDVDMDEAEMRKKMRAMMPAKKSEELPDVGKKAVSWETVRDEVQKLIFPRSPFETGIAIEDGFVKATYDDYVIICKYSKADGNKHYKVTFERDENGHVAQLGTAQEVEMTFVPKKSINEEFVKAALEGVDLSDVPLVTHTDVITTLMSALEERTRDLSERRTKEGRVFSSKNQAAIVAASQKMMVLAKELIVLVGGMEAEPEGKALRSRKIAIAQLKAQQLLEQQKEKTNGS